MAIDLANFASDGPWGFAWPGCCCPATVDCLVYADIFDCDDDPLGSPNWDQVSGTWTIVDPSPPDCDGQYLESGSAGSIIICLNETDDYQQILSMQIEENTGSLPRVLVGVDYTPGSPHGTVNSYYYAEFDFDNNKIRLGSNGGQLAEFDVTLSSGVNVSVWLSGDDTDGTVALSAGVGSSCHTGSGGYVCVSEPTGKYSGLANGSGATAAAHFSGGGGDNQYYLENHTDTPNVTLACGDCDCLCNDTCVPRQLNYKLTALAGNDACCIGTTTGTIDYTDQPTEDVCTWEAETIDICPDEGYDLNLKFHKPTGERKSACADWFMEDAGFPGVNEWPTNQSTPDSCTCNPVYFKWDEITLNYGAGYPTCKYMLEVYE